MPRWLKISLRLVAGLILLVVLLWLGLAAYVNANKKSVLRAVTEQLNDNINGELKIASMEPSLLKGFPGISFELKGVKLHDSLYDQHKHPLVDAKYVYVSVNVFSIIKGTPNIKAITVKDANIYLYTDSTGYSNKSIFQKKADSAKKGEKEQPKIGEFYFNNVEFVFENETKFKYFRIHFNSLSGDFDHGPTGWTADAKVDAFIKEFNFNINAGSFLKDKKLVASLKLSYADATQDVTVPLQDIKIDNDVLKLGATFFTDETPTRFTVNVRTNNILYKNALSMMSPNITKNLKYLDLKEPLALKADIYGLMKFRDTPLVNISWNIKDNVFTVPGAEITDINFTGDYTNGLDPNKGHNDRNSRIHAYGMTGKYMDIPFRADTIEVTNLITPTLEGRFKSQFSITKLGPVLGDRTFRFKEGEADMNLVYKGSLNPKDDTTPTYVNGYVQVKNAAMSYAPRNLNFTNSNLTLLFRGHDLFLKDVRLKTGSTNLYMNGEVLSFINLYYTNPTKVLIDLDIKSPLVNLNEFRSLISNRSSYQRPGNNNTQINNLARQLDEVLEESSVHMDVNVDKVTYRKFNASNINADITMSQKAISVKNVHVNHADGTILLDANLDQGGAINKLTMDAQIQNVHVNELLAAFENFGQTTLNPKNIKGRFFATAKMSGIIRDNGDLEKYSLNGKLDFNLKDGELINFAPLVNVGKYIFRKRKLEHVVFKDLKNTLQVKGDKIVIPPMMIESSAINAKVEGVYAIGPGTDIGIAIPLRNPDKDEVILDDSLREEQQMKGIIIRLHAVDDGDGNVKIKLGDRDESELEKAEKKEKQQRKRNRRNRRN